MPVERGCEVCGTIFYSKPSRVKTSHTCSNECRHKRHARKVIEVFGRAFHDPEVAFFPVGLKSQPEGRKEVLKQHGYDCLILWDDEINSDINILDRITAFSGV
jgi:hypothetical protein